MIFSMCSKFFIQIYDHQLMFPWNHFHIPYILSVFFPHKYKINFCFTSTSDISDFPFVFLIRPNVCHAQLFHHRTLAISFLLHFFPNTIPLMYTFKTLSTFSHMSIEISQRIIASSRTSRVPLTCHFIVKTYFPYAWSST